MMQCKYHPLTAAANRCPLCNISVCTSCSDETPATRNGQGALCFICSSSLEPTATSQQVEPFWNRLGPIYLYPLNVESISAILIIAFLSAFIRNIPFAFVLPLLAIMTYGYACLRKTARGEMMPPGVEACFEGNLLPVFFTAALAYGSSIVMNYLGQGFSPAVMISLNVFLICIFPAIVILMAVHDDPVSALNPGDWISVVRATGSAYFVMLLFVLIMYSSIEFLQNYLGDPSKSPVKAFASAVVLNYYAIVVFHIMGYLVYQHQDHLDFALDQGDQESKLRSPSKILDAKLDVLLMEGEYDQARDIASKKARAHGSSLWDWSKAFKLACIGSGNNRAAIDLFYSYIERLEAAGDMAKVADAYLNLIKKAPDFVIPEFSKRLEIADALFDIGEYLQVIKLLNGFHEDCNDHKLIADALKLRGDSFAKIPGREKHAEHYLTLHQLALKKAQDLQT